MTTQTNTQPATAKRSANRRPWLVGALAAAAVMALAPATASAQTDNGGEGGDYVTTTLPGEESIDVGAFAPACIRDAPYINYTIVPIGFVPTDTTATLEMTDRNGNFVETVEVSSLSGTIIYPGAMVDADGNGTDWPGWQQADDGSWIPDESDAILREGLTIKVTVNPTATVRVSYPDADAPCASPLSQGVESESTGTLPRTGGNGMTGPIAIGIMLMLAGAAALVTARRRKSDHLTTPA